LTDRLLALTGSDADSLIDQALERFQNEDIAYEKSYRRLPKNLLPASFVNAEQVESLVEGLCAQANRSEVYSPELLPLFSFWISLSPTNPESLITTATFKSNVARETEEQVESLYEEAFRLYERASKESPDRPQLWNNWGSSLGEFADQIRFSAPERAASLYEESANKLRRSLDQDPEMYGAWYNLGKCFGKLAKIYQDDDPEESLYFEAFDRYERAAEINSESHDVWYNWGRDLGDFAKLTEETNPGLSESLYRDAFKKFERAAELSPENHVTWGNWGTELVRLSRLLDSQGRNSEDELSRAVEKLQRSFSEERDDRTLFWLIVALTERNQEDDIEQAVRLLETCLDDSPKIVSWFFDAQEAEAVREHPELREILNAYREQVDEDAMEEAESPEELDAPDLSE
jgi:tetratricopeptide (TPR) repeat protein